MKVNRRRFLAGSALTAVAVAAGETSAAAPAAPATALTQRIPFDGPHQAGVLTEPRDAVVLAALDSVATDLGALVAGLRLLSARARELTQGWAMPVREPDEPPPDSGALGTEIAPDALTVTIGFGASLFEAPRPQGPREAGADEAVRGRPARSGAHPRRRDPPDQRGTTWTRPRTRCASCCA